MTGTLLTGARVVVPDGVLEGGWVRVSDGLITGLGQGPVRTATAASAVSVTAEETVELGGALLVPGFVDLHSHGGGGHDYGDSLPDIRSGVAFHRSKGTTRTLISLMTAPVEVLLQQLTALADLVEAGDPGVAGVHL